MDSVDNKKVTLEHLSKEELLKKCKGLITLVQKAKASKEFLQEENNVLKKQLQIDPTNEILEKLTEEKLLLVTQIEELKLKNRKFEDKVKMYAQDQEKITRLETENTSYSRQVHRLTDENEQLISDLSTLEAQIAELHKLGIEQKGQLLKFEKSNEISLNDLQSSLGEVQKLNDILKIKEKEIFDISQELQALKIISSSLNNSNKNCDKCIKDIDELKITNESCTNELSAVKTINEKLKDKVTSYHSKLKKFALTTKEIKEEKNQVIKIFKAYTEQIKEWKEQLLNASNQLLHLVNHLENENRILKISEAEFSNIKVKLEANEKILQSVKDENEKLKTELQEIDNKYNSTTDQLKHNKAEVDVLNVELTKQLKQYEAENQHLKESLIASKEDINKLNDALKQSLVTDKQLAQKSSEEILKLVQSNNELEEKYSQVQNELDLLKNKNFEHNFAQTDELDVSQNSFEEHGIDLRRENSELLLEMNQMNQALKERGELISKLEAHCDEIKKKLQLHENQANKNINSITEKEETIRVLSGELKSLKSENDSASSGNEHSKDVEISNLKAEIEALRVRCNNSIDSSYAESETMSTSTISRSEEVNRLKDLEGSWEERYGKLRTLAIKLKAKIREQGNVISKMEKEREEIYKKHSASLKSVQNLQLQIDSLQDGLEKANAENKQYIIKLNSVATNISKDKQLLVQNEETIGKLTKEIDKFNSDKQTLETWKKQVGAKVQTLRKELEAKNVVFKESENKVSQLENELESKMNQLKAEQESHKQTKSLLDQTSSECKKNSVLNLEMQDYERSVKELTQKIDKQKNEINNLQSQLDIQKNTVNALREQNKILEERITEQEKNGNSSTLEMNACKKNITNLEGLLEQKEDKIMNVTKLLETTRSENEELSTELSKLIAEHQKSVNMIKSERDQLRNQILSIQHTLRHTQDVLKLREDELGAIKEDYEIYKVRAQSVLKKNQNRDLGLEERLSEELTTVRSQHSNLNDELKVFRDKLENERNSNEILAKQRDGLMEKTKELESEVEELKNFGEQLGAKHQKAIVEHAETVRNLKVHAETLSQCYRQQLSEQEVRHNREIIELQSRLDKAPSPVETVPVPPSMPREEGEGSESIESNPPPNNVHPIPLERLLDSKSDDEVVHFKKLLLEQESKVVHLTALLSDTEQDLAKHVQMNKVLKEEIRRQQRSVEREKHAENLEYLKNVVFKFVTLNSGDERTRLVPVLNTILKLSPEETQKLTSVARGDPGIKGWASYLPTWPSPNKPQ